MTPPPRRRGSARLCIVRRAHISVPRLDLHHMPFMAIETEVEIFLTYYTRGHG